MQKSEHYRPEIDGLRAWAVLPVVLFHAGVPGFSGGFVGVDVFFVISGFLITQIIYSELVERRFSIIRFYERRARRILPALSVVLVAATLVAAILMNPAELARFGQSLVATVFFGSNLWFLRTTDGYFSPDSKFHPLLHTWSLAVEEQFYIFFPLLLMLCVRLVPKRVKPIAIAIVAVSFAYSVWRLNDSVIWRAEHAREVFYFPLGRVWELGLGSLLALGVFPPVRPSWRAPLGVLALLLLVLPVFLYDEKTQFPGLAALPPCLGALLVIRLGECGPTRILTWRPFVFVGLISYSFYLWHWPVIVLLRGLIGGAPLPLSWALGAIAASALLAWLSWRYVERPFRQPKLFQPRTFFAMCGATLALLLMLGVGIWSARGLPQRFAPEQLAVFAAHEDVNPRRLDCGMQRIDRLCRIGAPTAAPSFLLWGDSHGDSAQPGFELAAQRTGTNGYVSSRWGCAPLVGAEQSAPDCTKANRDIMAWLASHPEIKQVFLVARWPLYESGYYQDGQPEVRPVFLSRVPEESQTRLFNQALAQTVAQLAEMGKQVTVFGDVPEIKWNVPVQISAQQRFGAALPPAPTLAEVTARHAASEATIRRLGVPFVPVYPLMCPAGCNVTGKNGLPLYSDADHLTATTSRAVYAPLVEPLLRPAAPAPQDEAR